MLFNSVFPENPSHLISIFFATLRNALCTKWSALMLWHCHQAISKCSFIYEKRKRFLCVFENSYLSMSSLNNVEQTFHASHKDLSLRPVAGKSCLGEANRIQLSGKELV